MMVEEPPKSWAEAPGEADIEALELSARARKALRQAGVRTVGEVPEVGVLDLSRLRNVGWKTVEEVAHLRSVLRRRLMPGPALEASPEGGSEKAPPKTIERLIRELLPPSGRWTAAEKRVLEPFLGLTLESATALGSWPTQRAVAETLGVSSARVGKVLGDAGRRWLVRPPWSAVRADVVAILARHGGVMTAAALADALLALRGSASGAGKRRRLARAVVRAAVVAEAVAAAARFKSSRRSGQLFVVLTGAGEARQAGEGDPPPARHPPARSVPDPAGGRPLSAFSRSLA